MKNLDKIISNRWKNKEEERLLKMRLRQEKKLKEKQIRSKNERV